jgi:hypothetical protein
MPHRERYAETDEEEYLGSGDGDRVRLTQLAGNFSSAHANS